MLTLMPSGASSDAMPFIIEALTPIVYPVHILPPSYAKWIAINPVTPIVQALQAIFVQHEWPAWPTLAYPAVLAMALGLLSATVFRRQAPWIVDEL